MKRTRWATLAMSISFLLGTIIAVVMLPIGTIELRAIEAAGRELYAPPFSVDYTRGIYPALLGMAYLGGALTMITFGFLAVSFFRQEWDG